MLAVPQKYFIAYGSALRAVEYRNYIYTITKVNFAVVHRRDFAPEGCASRFGGKTLLRTCARLGRGKLVLSMSGESEHNTLGSGPASA